MHRVLLLLVLGLLLAGPAAPARLGPKHVSVPNPGVAFLKQTLCCSQGLFASDCSEGLVSCDRFCTILFGCKAAVQSHRPQAQVLSL